MAFGKALRKLGLMRYDNIISGTPRRTRVNTDVKTKADPYKASDGKHYWNCWTNNYLASRDGYCQHAFCEEDRTGKTLCGAVSQEGGGISIPNELDKPSCLKCSAIMLKRGALRPPKTNNYEK